MRSLSAERRHQSVTDELTGLGNRRYLFTVLDAFFADYDVTAARPRSIAFLFLDLNHFKEINDTFGHPVGDKLLKQLGPRLSACLREADLPIRLGGDEFVVVLVDGDAGYATAVAQRLTDRLAEPFVLDTVRVHISASIGIALAPTDATDAASLLWCADVAMYRAKLAGTPFAIYQPDLDKSGNRLLLLDELRTAIDERQLVLHYQPQLDLRTGRIVAVESLLRWVHPRLGIVSPLEFLPLAEEAGLMGAITTLVLTDALAQCAAWRNAGNPCQSRSTSHRRTFSIRGSQISSATSSKVIGCPPKPSFWRSPRRPSSPTLIDPEVSSKSSGTRASWCRSTTSAPASPHSPTSVAWR
jgi:diguanylate cyclase (GGDEF)-like protein